MGEVVALPVVKSEYVLPKALTRGYSNSFLDTMKEARAAALTQQDLDALDNAA